MLKRAFQIIVNMVVWSSLLLLSAGTLQWPRAWLLIGLMLIGLGVNFIVVKRYNPQIAEVRSKIEKGTKAWDKILMLAFGLLNLVLPVVAGLDAIRFSWSSLPRLTIYAGVILYVVGSVLITWVLAINPYLETTVRIQNDRGQQVVTSGPYRIIRHPMYSGMLIQYLGLPLILGSIYSYMVVVAIVLLFIIRTYQEDQTLAKELPGYLNYRQDTPYRLLPGIW